MFSLGKNLISLITCLILYMGVCKKTPGHSGIGSKIVNPERNLYSIESFRLAQNITIKAFQKWNTGESGKRNEALILFEKAVSVSLFAFDARHRLALARWNEGRYDDALALWNETNNIMIWYVRNHGYNEIWDTVHRESLFVHGTSKEDGLPHKLIHDSEQLLYLHQLNVSSKLFESPSDIQDLSLAYGNVGKRLEEMHPNQIRYGNEYGFMTLSNAALEDLLGKTWGYNWLSASELHLPMIDSDSASVFRPQDAHQLADFVKIFQRTGVLIVDDLFTPSALEIAYEACLRTPMWHEVKPWGYLGAYITSGMAISHPVFMKIAKEFPKSFKPIFDIFKHKTTSDVEVQGDSTNVHQSSSQTDLNMMWAYKYDNHARADGTGIGIHADDARININIWLTPDDANLESQQSDEQSSDSGGGLIIYNDMAAPGWSQHYEDRSTDLGDRVREQWRGRSNVTIPYKQNRMVLFDSERYHRTSSFRFKRGYRNRRINLTLLFGDRKSNIEVNSENGRDTQLLH